VSERLREIARRLRAGLSSELGLAIFSEDVASEEEVRSVLAAAALQGAVGVRKLVAKAPPAVLVAAFVREEPCWKKCEEKCGDSKTLCFGECFYDCLESLKQEVASALERVEAGAPK